MTRCHYCNWGGGEHDAHCPEVTGKHDEYQRGRNDGRGRKTADPNGGGTYRLGYARGDAAADEAENGHQAWGY